MLSYNNNDALLLVTYTYGTSRCFLLLFVTHVFVKKTQTHTALHNRAVPCNHVGLLANHFILENVRRFPGDVEQTHGPSVVHHVFTGVQSVPVLLHTDHHLQNRDEMHDRVDKNPEGNLPRGVEHHVHAVEGRPAVLCEVQVPEVQEDTGELRDVLADNGRGRRALQVVHAGVRDAVRGARGAGERDAVPPVPERGRAGRADRRAVPVRARAEPEHVLLGDAVRRALLRAVLQAEEDQPRDHRAQARAADELLAVPVLVPGLQQRPVRGRDRHGRARRRRLRRYGRWLRPRGRSAARRGTFRGQRHRSVADQALADTRGGRLPERAVRHTAGHVRLHAVHHVVLRHLLRDVPRDGQPRAVHGRRVLVAVALRRPLHRHHSNIAFHHETGITYIGTQGDFSTTLTPFFKNA